MTDHDELALIAAIIANHDDDTPRLAYADWLEENAGVERVARPCTMCVGGKQNDCEPGDLHYNEWDCEHCQGTGEIAGERSNGFTERAEFIRLQCRIASIQRTCLCGACVKLRGGGQHHNGPCAVDQERDELPDGTSRQALLRRRERELLHANVPGKPWLTRAYEWFNPTGIKSFDYRRGFVESVTCSAADWETHGDAITATQPVQSVTFTDSAPDASPSARMVKVKGVWCLQAIVAGKFAYVPDGTLIPNPELGDGLHRAFLSARWPTIPPDGWTFSAPVQAVGNP